MNRIQTPLSDQFYLNTTHMNPTKSQSTRDPRDAVAEVRALIESEFSDIQSQQPHILRLALNEAEALAWQTGVPHLVFPELAVEKASAVAAWHFRQQSIRRPDSISSFAA